ncbi:MAG: hypothetical protein JNL72_06060 [Flavipsychrobacter sp.]|nr:hypothetical protein [Flavipsychrobacter sp.]
MSKTLKTITTPLTWLLSVLYEFLLYNYRVVFPVARRETFDTIPEVHVGFRIAYLLATWWLSSFILTLYAPLMEPTVPPGHPYREYLVCGGQIIFQAIVISFFRPAKLWDYLGNMMTISFAASLMLVVGMCMARLIPPPPLAYVCYFLALAGLMLLEHIRRSTILRLGWLMTATWLLYRAIVLVIIFILG